MKRRKTNEEFIASIMTFSRRGALIQPFVIAALENYAKAVVAAHELGESWSRSGLTQERPRW